MGEILSKGTSDLLNNEKVKEAVNTFIKSDKAPAPVSIDKSTGEHPVQVNFRIASS